MKAALGVHFLKHFLAIVIFLGCASFVAYRQRLSKIYISFVLRKAGVCYGGYRGLRNNLLALLEACVGHVASWRIYKGYVGGWIVRRIV